MYRQPFYSVEEFWFGLVIGLAIVAACVLLFSLRTWALRRIRFNLAKRVSTNFVVAGEIFRLLRLPRESATQLTPEILTRLTAGIESHGSFFANLLDDKQSFCLFFGKVFGWAFDDICQIYVDFAEGCAQLKYHLSRMQDEDGPLPVEMDRYLRVITSATDPTDDLTYFRLSRAMAIIDTVCRPILDEHANRHGGPAKEPKFPQLAAALAKPA